MQDVAEHTGGILVQVAGSFGHAIVLAANGDVDALFLQKKKKILPQLKFNVQKHRKTPTRKQKTV